jgi:CRISPR-associated protein Csx10
LDIRLESDWHIGSGEGIPGSTDRTVLRDENGLPYIPGKTLTGILRKSAKLAASVYGNKGNGSKGSKNKDDADWDDVFLSLFGDQSRRARIGIGDAVFSDSLKNNILQHEELASALFIVQPGVKVDAKTGTSMPDFLFTREEVRGGVTLHAEIIEIDGPLSKQENKLLLMATQAARGLGGNCNRGGGKCKMTLEPDKTPQGQATGGGPNLKNIKANGGFVELEFLLETLQPVIVKRASTGVVVQSETFIPGTQLIRHFVERIPDEAAQAQIWTAVMEGTFSVGAFYPEVNGCVTYPAPPAQNAEELIPNLPASPGASVMYRTRGVVQGNRGFFTYQAIKSGQKFRGTLRITEALWKELGTKGRSALVQANYASIGLSKKDEYGRTKITCSRQAAPIPCNSKKENKGKKDNKEKDKDNNKENFMVYLASDVLVRNKETLAFTSDVADFKKSMEETLGIPLDDDPQRVHCVRWGRRESWHSVWNLPRPSLVYLQAGSVFFFKSPKLPQNFDWSDAGNKLLSGIGDRVGEGYGRVLLNPQFPAPLGAAADDAGDNASGNDVPAGGHSLDLAAPDLEFFALLKKECLKTAFRKFSRKYITRYINNNEDPKKFFPNLNLKGISSRQIGILRRSAVMIVEQQNIAPFADLGGRDIPQTWRQFIAKSDLWGVVEDPGLQNLITQTLKDELKIFTLSAFLDTLCEFSLDAQYHSQKREEAAQ